MCLTVLIETLNFHLHIMIFISFEVITFVHFDLVLPVVLFFLFFF